MTSENSSKVPHSARFAILMACYNGEKFIAAQLESIRMQTVARINVWASDDRSSDETVRILQDWGEHWDKGRIEVLNGPRKGSAENFRSLIVNDAIDAEYYAFADQDDIWDADKLEKAQIWFNSRRNSGPAIYCSRTRIVDVDGAFRGLSLLFRKPPAFRNAIIQNIAGGNTMVLNRAARDLIAAASRRTGFEFHDWWSYMVVTGAGGEVFCSSEPLVSYRQHGGNLVGNNNSWKDRLARIRLMLAGGYRHQNQGNILALEQCADLLNASAHKTTAQFKQCREAGFFGRLAAFWRSGIYRQTARGQAGLVMAVILKRL